MWSSRDRRVWEDGKDVLGLPLAISDVPVKRDWLCYFCIMLDGDDGLRWRRPFYAGCAYYVLCAQNIHLLLFPCLAKCA
ncbi:hypothetical protein M407DRAFT_161728 [Tulasnella calospora MUT 4182]|uniref:Uncharacterized protein n=1 Tax=Tulasnella calospora MUT 4182 TaxID=1051891 RepID=A0A0C3Q4K6_9AGAM|nr:hypothetical protein M407DRAFT_161728 [Tulasnella calospora MUT 4182]